MFWSLLGALLGAIVSALMRVHGAWQRWTAAMRSSACGDKIVRVSSATPFLVREHFDRWNALEVAYTYWTRARPYPFHAVINDEYLRYAVVTVYDCARDELVHAVLDRYCSSAARFNVVTALSIIMAHSRVAEPVVPRVAVLAYDGHEYVVSDALRNMVLLADTTLTVATLARVLQVLGVLRPSSSAVDGNKQARLTVFEPSAGLEKTFEAYEQVEWW